MRIEVTLETADERAWIVVCDVGQVVRATREYPGEAAEVEILEVIEDTEPPHKAKRHASWDAFVIEYPEAAGQLADLEDAACDAASDVDMAWRDDGGDEAYDRWVDDQICGVSNEQ